MPRGCWSKTGGFVLDVLIAGGVKEPVRCPDEGLCPAPCSETWHLGAGHPACTQGRHHQCLSLFQSQRNSGAGEMPLSGVMRRGQQCRPCGARQWAYHCWLGVRRDRLVSLQFTRDLFPSGYLARGSGRYQTQSSAR